MIDSLTDMNKNIVLIGDLCSDPGKFYSSQHYYLMGLQTISGQPIDIVPPVSALCFNLYQRHFRGAHKIWRLCNKYFSSDSSEQADKVGRYLFRIGSQTVKTVIDASDGRTLRDVTAYRWADVYFKANKWPSLSYPDNVHPLVNGNGSLNPQKLVFLKKLRHTPKTRDLVFISPIWSKRHHDRFDDIFEHQIRTFEALARVQCDKHLLAIIPTIYPQPLITGYLKRFDAAGVPWQYTYQGMTSEQLFASLAEARLVFLRPGNELCISWRMMDLLCMGACIVCDGSPYPSWPVPLRTGVNYISCDCGLREDYTIPPAEHYTRIRQTVEDLLTDPGTIQSMYEQNRQYFDDYGAPDKVAQYIHHTVRSTAAKF